MAKKAGQVAAVVTLCVMALLVASASPALAGSVQTSDDTFAPPNWTVTPFSIGNGASVSASQQAAGGNPGAYRSVRNVVAAAPTATTFSAILGAHVFGGFTYDPSITGAILSLNYSEDVICLPPNCFGDGHATGVVVRQNGNIYLASSGITGSSTAWHTISASGLDALDFLRLAPSSTAFVDATSHPDFTASGDPIEVGFARSNSTCLGCGGYTLDAGIDNWLVVINFADREPPPPNVPSPGPLVLLGAALATLGVLRRLR